MILVWRGVGVAVPVCLAIAAGIASLFVDDTRLGNLEFTGYSSLIGAALCVLPALATLGGDRGAWLRHSFFVIPVLIWVPILAGGGTWALGAHNPASEKIVGEWKFARCLDPCAAHELQRMHLSMDGDAVAVNHGEPREYTVTVDSDPVLRWRYDDATEEAMYFLGPDEITAEVGESTVVFARQL